MIRRLLFLLLMCAAPAFAATGVRYDGTVQSRSGFPAPGATVAVCSQPAVTTTTPCSPLATLYTDATLTVPCSGTLLPPNTPSSACSNPMITDGLGNYHFYFAGGPLTVQFSGSGLSTSNLPDQFLTLSGFGGSVSANQVAYGSGANIFTSSANMTYVPALGGLVIQSSTVGPTNVTGANIALSNSAGGTTAYIVKDIFGGLTIRNDSLLIATHGLLAWDGNSNMLLEAGGGGPALNFYSAASVAPFGFGSGILSLQNTGGGPHVFAVNTANGGFPGYISFDPYLVGITFGGATNGTAALGVNANAGTPAEVLLPTTTAAAGQRLQSDGSSPQNTSWVTTGSQCGTMAANAACANTLTQAEHCVSGIATLGGGTSTITGIVPAFTGSTTFNVTTNDVTTSSNPSKGVPASGSSITFTGTGTDNISFVACGG